MNNFKILKKQPNNFINIIFDNWRGWRLIFDTKEVRNCKNNCPSCALYLLLKKNNLSNELYKANSDDKKIFGKQNVLNCKTIEQYINCYVNFILNKTKTKKEIANELNLVKEARVIYSKENWDSKLFRQKIFQTLLKKADGNKKKKNRNHTL